MSQLPNGFTGFPANKNFQYSRDFPASDSAAVPSFDPEKLSLIPGDERRWAWAEINLNAIRHNIAEARKRIGRGCRIMAVVKADAYGHGAVKVAKTAINSGAEYLGVATIDEAIELREALINVPILVLSQPPESAIPLLLAYKIMPTVYAPDFAIQYGEAADAYGVRAPYHLKVNTGMNRVGLRYNEVVDFMMQVDFHRALDLVGTFTHFATADQAESFEMQTQLRRFHEAVNAMRAAGINPGIVHAANSAALFRFPETHFDMVRLGVSLYGVHPCQETRVIADLHPAMSVHARVSAVNVVPMSEGVSYGLVYRSPGNVRICTIPLGYADGLKRGLSGRADVILRGNRYRQVGRICMDQCMFEVDMRVYGNRERIEPQVGEEVIILGRQGDSIISADDLAYAIDTISYEILCGFGQRLAKVYV